jgi:hypothetical protein
MSLRDIFIDARRNHRTSSFLPSPLDTARRSPTEFRRAWVSSGGFRRADKVCRFIPPVQSAAFCLFTDSAGRCQTPARRNSQNMSRRDILKITLGFNRGNAAYTSLNPVGGPALCRGVACNAPTDSAGHRDSIARRNPWATESKEIPRSGLGLGPETRISVAGSGIRCVKSRLSHPALAHLSFFLI